MKPYRYLSVDEGGSPLVLLCEEPIPALAHRELPPSDQPGQVGRQPKREPARQLSEEDLYDEWAGLSGIDVATPDATSAVARGAEEALADAQRVAAEAHARSASPPLDPAEEDRLYLAYAALDPELREGLPADEPDSDPEFERLYEQYASHDSELRQFVAERKARRG